MTQDKPPFSHPVRIGQISASATELRIKANEDERKALADLWNVSEILSLSSEIQVARWKKDGVRIKGRVTARIVQPCVVTLEPVESQIDEPIEMTFVPDGSRLAKKIADESTNAVIDPDAPDLPDVFTGDEIDVGAAVAEQAALAIDPYPRKPGASFGERIESNGTDDVRPNPFAVLKDWKKD